MSRSVRDIGMVLAGLTLRCDREKNASVRHDGSRVLRLTELAKKSGATSRRRSPRKVLVEGSARADDLDLDLRVHVVAEANRDLVFAELLDRLCEDDLA